MSKVAIITGCSSGLGIDLAVLLSKTHKVYATLRDTSKAKELKEEIKKNGKTENVVIESLDVSSDDSVDSFFEKVKKQEKTIDVLINNAGYSLFGPIEKLSLKQVHEQMNTNYYGSIRCTKHVLPVMRKQRSGKVVFVSSIGGTIGTWAPFNDAYCASKFAIEGLAECLYPFYKKFGVNIILINPGGIKTKFVDNAEKTLGGEKDEVQGGVFEFMQYYQKRMTEGGDDGTVQTPLQVAKVVEKVLNEKEQKEI